MTEEELKKEAEEYAGMGGLPKEKHFFGVKVLAYLAGAESREKRITELEGQVTRAFEVLEDKRKQIQIDAEQIRALQKQNGELTDELAKKADTNHQLVEQMAKLSEENAELKQAKEGKVVEHFEAYGQCRDSRRIAELEAQIEKMKIKWHDLEKDPNDLPKDYKTMCICLSDFGSKYEPVPRVCVGYCDSLGWSDYMGSSLYSTVRYWCELPKGR